MAPDLRQAYGDVYALGTLLSKSGQPVFAATAFCFITSMRYLELKRQRTDSEGFDNILAEALGELDEAQAGVKLGGQAMLLLKTISPAGKILFKDGDAVIPELKIIIADTLTREEDEEGIYYNFDAHHYDRQFSGRARQKGFLSRINAERGDYILTPAPEIG